MATIGCCRITPRMGTVRQTFTAATANENADHSSLTAMRRAPSIAMTITSSHHDKPIPTLPLLLTGSPRCGRYHHYKIRLSLDPSNAHTVPRQDVIKHCLLY